MSNLDAIIRATRAELVLDFVTSSGPGGQNVNKVATEARLRFDVRTTALLPEAVKARLVRLAGTRVTSEGVLIIAARKYRSQERNRADAIARFDDLLRRAFERPKQRVPTKATHASHEKRLARKKRKGEIKKARQGPSYDLS